MKHSSASARKFEVENVIGEMGEALAKPSGALTGESAAQTPPQPENQYNTRILVVEDEIEIAGTYKAILEPKPPGAKKRSSRLPNQQASDITTIVVAVDFREGYELEIVHSAEEALKSFDKSIRENRPFAMAFFDVLLGGGIDGIELARQVFLRDKKIQVVFVTAYQDRSVDSINQVLGEENSSRWDYLNKPFSEGEIAQKARQAVQIWNLQQQQEQHELTMQAARARLLTSERLMSVATVARGVGHEFGNILLHIMGRAELSKYGDEKELRNSMDVIVKACETASGILEKFNSLSQPHHLNKTKEMISLLTPLREAIELTKHELMQAEVNIKCLTEERDISADKNSLVQVFVNLLMNAVDASPEACVLDITYEVKSEFVEMKLRDHGPGIPQEILAHITEAFFTTKGDAGTGLGLAICKEIIEIEHAGEFIVSNHEENGAVFTLRLPVKNHFKESVDET